MKIYRFLLLITLIAGLSFYSCTSNTKKKSTSSQSTALKDFTTITNDRYNFSFELPLQWKAGDVSDNGDGYIIETGDANVDFRIYAQQKLGLDDDDYEKKEPFIFDDGTKGSKCYYSDTEYFIYKNNKNTTIAFYIDTNEAWLKEHYESLNAIAKSMKFTHEESNY